MGMFKKEAKEFKETFGKNVEVSDIPEHWKKAQNNLKVTVHNQDQIEKEWNDVEHVGEKIQHSQPVRNLGSSLERWGESDEVAQLKALDEKFKASPEGQRLIAEWTDVFQVLDKHTYHNDAGFHIDNEAMPEIEDELDDVADQYEDLEGSKWDHAYEAGWKAATENKEAHSVARRFQSFKKSPEGQAWGKEMHELGETIKQNVEVTDIPEHWKKAQNNLKVTVHNQDDIEKEWNDVEHVAHKIQHSQPVRNLGSSLERWGESDEVAHIKKIDKAFAA